MAVVVWFAVVLLCLVTVLAEPVLHVYGSVENFRNNHIYANVGDSVELICSPQKPLAASERQYLRWVDGRNNDVCKNEQSQYSCTYGNHLGRTALTLTTKVFQPAVLTCKYTQQHNEDWNVTVKIYTRTVDYPAVDFNDTTPIEFSCPLQLRNKKVVWYLNGKLLESDEHTQLFDNGTLFIAKPSIRNAGVYMCHTDDKQFSFFEVRGKATIVEKTQSSKNYMVDDSTEIHCLVYGHPLPKVSWKMDGSDLTSFDSRVYATSYMGVANASLVLKDLKYEDRAVYTCVATNELGLDESAVLLRVKDKLAALWPFLGILVEVIILMTIIFFFEKRRLKKEREELHSMPEQKVTLTAPNNDKDVRQRKN